MYILDVECYSNIFLLCLQHHKTGERRSYRLPGASTEQREEVNKLLRTTRTFSFNGLNYDLPMICAFVNGADNTELKALSDDIITSDKPRWEVLNDHAVSISDEWKEKHIDLIEITIGKSSLKIYGGRLNCKKMQDLPLDPALPVPEDKLDLLEEYCFNDLQVTGLLLDHLWKQIELRAVISKKYGINLRSKSDAQMAEAVIRSLVLKGKKIERDQLTSVRYTPPEYVKFSSKNLQDVLDMITKTDFLIHKTNGSVCMPEWLADKLIRIKDKRYQMGIGGLHSCEKRQYVKAGDKFYLADWDVASMYPTMIVNQKLAPRQMGEKFIEVYKGFVEERLAAKHSGDKVTADTLKIFLNGSFGKFGSIYSTLYSPKLLIQTTITGQLSLLMLIEAATEAGIKVVSANTDGVVMLCPKANHDKMIEVTEKWMATTGMTLERTDYKLLASRDVNSYVAVKTDGEVKRKGVFADQSLAKNPDRLIIYDAVAAHLASGRSIKSYIMDSKDITRFVTVRKVSGGAKWRGEELGRAVRFYHSNEVGADECLQYIKTGNKVPNSDGCKPLMELPDEFPTDIDYEYYIKEANNMLKEVGYA